MKFMHALILAATVFTLAACNSNEEEATNSGSANNAPTDAQSVTDHAAKDKAAEEVGFEMAGGNIEEATNVPEEEKTAILAAFNEYMEAFNVEDIDRYMNTISKNPEGFNYADEKTVVQETFTEYDTIRKAENTTIIKYDKSQAQVFANINIALSQPSTGAKLDRDGRQVTVFAKEDGKWLVTSVYFIGESSE